MLLGSSGWVVRLTNLVMGTLTVGLIFSYTRTFFRSRPVACLAAFAAACYGPFVFFDTSRLKTTLGLLLVAAGLTLLSRLQSRSGIVLWLFIGLLLGLAVNLSGQLILFILSLFITWVVSVALTQLGIGEKNARLAWGRPLPAMLGLGAGLILALFPFAVRNHGVTGEWLFGNCTRGIHFYIGNGKKAWGGYARVPGVRANPAGHFFDAKKIAERKMGRPLKYAEVSRYWQRRAWQEIRSDPHNFLALLGRKLLLIISPYEIPNNENYQYLKARSNLLPHLPGAGLILPLCFAGWMVAIFRRQGPLVLHLFIGTYMAALLSSFITWRYRLPLLLGLLPFGALLVVEFVSKISDHKRMRALLLIFPVMLFWAAGYLHPVAERRGPGDLRRAEHKMHRVQQMAQLLNRLQTEKDMSPRQRAGTWMRLARVHVYQGDLEGAVRVLQTAIVEFPHHNGIKQLKHELSLRTGGYQKRTQ